MLLNEADIVSPDLTINRPALLEIATCRAKREEAAYEADGGSCPFPFRDLLAAEISRLESTAAMIIETRALRRELAALSPKAHLLASLEWELARLEHATVVDDRAIAHNRALLRDVMAAAGDDASVMLASKLMEIAP